MLIKWYRAVYPFIAFFKSGSEYLLAQFKVEDNNREAYTNATIENEDTITYYDKAKDGLNKPAYNQF